VDGRAESLFPTISPQLIHNFLISLVPPRIIMDDMALAVIRHAPQLFARVGVRGMPITASALTAGGRMENPPADTKAPYQTADLSPSRAP
jgi:hypothetical protein